MGKKSVTRRKKRVSPRLRRSAGPTTPDPEPASPPPTLTPEKGSASEAQLVPFVGKNRRKNQRYAMNKLKRRAAALLAADPSLASASQLVSFVASPKDVGQPSSGEEKRRDTECPGMEGSNGGDAQVEGFVFHCNKNTKVECFARGIFGLAKEKAYLVNKIRDGTIIFLFDIKLRVLYGVYRAVGNGGVDLEPEAFGGKFSAQVRFMIDNDCPPLPESVFKDAIKENYVSRKVFNQVLNSQQVTVLYKLFNQSMVHPGSFPSQTLTGATTPSMACDPQTAAVHDTSPADVILTTETCGEKRKEREYEEKKMESNRASIHPGSGKGICEAQIEGFIFYCDGKTKPDCFLHRVFGLRKKQAYLVEKIKAGTMLFLLDIELRLLYGIYRATGVGMLEMEPQAFGGKFPAQVRFVIDKDCPPLHESVFKDAIKENYTRKGKFSQVLNSHQVNMLCSLFSPINVLPHPVPCQQVKHLPASHLPHLEQSHRPNHICGPPSAIPSYGPQAIPSLNESCLPRHTCHACQLPPNVMPPPNVLCCYPATPTCPYSQRESHEMNPRNPIP